MRLEDFDPTQWDRWIGHSKQGPIVMLIKELWKDQGCHVDLHRMVGVDMPGCFHTHPALAIRWVREGGYVEELFFRDKPSELVERKPGYVGVVQPYTCHRIHELLNGSYSESLWLRGPVTHPIWLRGPGWPEELRDKKVVSGEDDKHRASIKRPDSDWYKRKIKELGEEPNGVMAAGGLSEPIVGGIGGDFGRALGILERLAHNDAEARAFLNEIYGVKP